MRFTPLKEIKEAIWNCNFTSKSIHFSVKWKVVFWFYWWRILWEFRRDVFAKVSISKYFIFLCFNNYLGSFKVWAV